MKKNKHNLTLEKILTNPELIGEANPLFILKEPKVFKTSHKSDCIGIKDLKPMCDLVIGFKGYAVPVEVKGSGVHRDKALKQIRYGREWILSELGLFVPYQKIVYYNNQGLGLIEYEEIR